MSTSAAQAPSAPPAVEASAIEVTVIVPVVTGDAEVGQVVEALGRELTRLGRPWECVLVFDGVRGAAWEEVRELEVRFGDRISTIAFQKPFGESVCLSAGAERARGRVIVTSPQYVQCDPAELGAMLAAIDAGADLVTPWRRSRVDPWLNRVQSATFNWVIRRLVRGEFHDLNCYFRAFRREVLEDVAIYGDLYRFLPVIAQRQGFRVVEVPVRHLKEWGEAGFFGVGVYVRRALDVLAVMFLTKFTLKPLRFFGSIGLMLLVPSGIALAVMVVQRLLGITSLHNRPAFILALMLFVLGVQVIGFGLVGEIIIYTQAKNLREYRIDRVYDDDVHDPSRRDRGAGDS